jgi:hypothetical protein
MSIKRV